MDLCTKDIVGYAMVDRITKYFAIKAINMSKHSDKNSCQYGAEQCDKYDG
ncbi:MAG: hypothetical protein ACYDG2_12495 [Ruminiclostridium sp.]